MSSIIELQKLDDDALQLYFEDNARYYQESPEDTQYAIRFGGKNLFSHDTMELREEFFRRVRSGE